MKKEKIETFDDWKDLFLAWQKGIGYDTKLFSSVLQGYEFSEKFSEDANDKIKFGRFSGNPKWKTVADISVPEAKDLLLRLISVQGDTEFASVEQQRGLLNSAPSDKDLRSLVRINAEEMRHGWQMSYLLVTQFGDAGKTEARKLLERCADRGERILGAFNEPVEDWLDFFTFTSFVDRDGMYQLKMLSHSGFAPLARSMGPMLNEESFHLLTGLAGLQRIIRAGKIPVATVQKVLNQWLPRCFDLFGQERSKGAGNAYRWGLKGRFNENEAGEVENLELLNEKARGLYRQEVIGLVGLLNKDLKEEKKLYVPDIKFNRSVGEYKGKFFSVTGEAVTEDAYRKHLKEVLPSENDRKRAREIFKEPDWIAPAA